VACRPFTAVLMVEITGVHGLDSSSRPVKRQRACRDYAARGLAVGSPRTHSAPPRLAVDPVAGTLQGIEWASMAILSSLLVNLFDACAAGMKGRRLRGLELRFVRLLAP